MRPSTLDALDAEWQRIARAPSSRASLIRWGRREPAIAGVADLDELLEARRQDPRTADAILRALAAVAARDVLASRVLLQALIPGLAQLAKTSGKDDHGALEEMLALAWERIRTYPESRSGSVPANVLWDVRKQYRRHREIDAPSGGGDEADADEPCSPSADGPAIARVMVAQLADAHRNEVVSDRTFRLIIRTRLVDEPLETIAREQSVNVHCLMERRARGERRLRAHLGPVA